MLGRRPLGRFVGVFGYALGTIVATGVYQVWSLL